MSTENTRFAHERILNILSSPHAIIVYCLLYEATVCCAEEHERRHFTVPYAGSLGPDR